MELNCILWYSIVSYGIALVLHGIAWYCKMQDVALYCTVSHCIILNLAVLHGIALYHCWLHLSTLFQENTNMYIEVVSEF